MKRATAVAGIGLVAAFGVVAPASGFVAGSDEASGGRDVAVGSVVAASAPDSDSNAWLAGSASLFLVVGAGTVLVAQRRRAALR